MNEPARYRTFSLGLTLLNLGLGLSLWSAIWEIMGAKWNFVALFLVSAGFFVVWGLAQCSQFPGESRARLAAIFTALAMLAFYLTSLYGFMATEEHRFPPLALWLAALGFAALLCFLFITIRTLRHRLGQDATVPLSWWMAAGLLAATTLLISVVLPQTELDVESILRIGSAFSLCTVAALSHVVIVAKSLAAQAHASQANQARHESPA